MASFDDFSVEFYVSRLPFSWLKDVIGEFIFTAHVQNKRNAIFGSSVRKTICNTMTKDSDIDLMVEGVRNYDSQGTGSAYEVNFGHMFIFDFENCLTRICEQNGITFKFTNEGHVKSYAATEFSSANKKGSTHYKFWFYENDEVIYTIDIIAVDSFDNFTQNMHGFDHDLLYYDTYKGILNVGGNNMTVDDCPTILSNLIIGKVSCLFYERNDHIIPWKRLQKTLKDFELDFTNPTICKIVYKAWEDIEPGNVGKDNCDFWKNTFTILFSVNAIPANRALDRIIAYFISCNETNFVDYIYTKHQFVPLRRLRDRKYIEREFMYLEHTIKALMDTNDTEIIKHFIELFKPIIEKFGISGSGNLHKAAYMTNYDNFKAVCSIFPCENEKKFIWYIFHEERLDLLRSYLDQNIISIQDVDKSMSNSSRNGLQHTYEQLSTFKLEDIMDLLEGSQYSNITNDFCKVMLESGSFTRWGISNNKFIEDNLKFLYKGENIIVTYKFIYNLGTVIYSGHYSLINWILTECNLILSSTLRQDIDKVVKDNLSSINKQISYEQKSYSNNKVIMYLSDVIASELLRRKDRIGSVNELPSSYRVPVLTSWMRLDAIVSNCENRS